MRPISIISCLTAVMALGCSAQSFSTDELALDKADRPGAGEWVTLESPERLYAASLRQMACVTVAESGHLGAWQPSDVLAGCERHQYTLIAKQPSTEYFSNVDDDPLTLALKVEVEGYGIGGKWEVVLQYGWQGEPNSVQRLEEPSHNHRVLLSDFFNNCFDFDFGGELTCITHTAQEVTVTLDELWATHDEVPDDMGSWIDAVIERMESQDPGDDGAMASDAKLVRVSLDGTPIGWAVMLDWVITEGHVDPEGEWYLLDANGLILDSNPWSI